MRFGAIKPWQVATAITALVAIFLALWPLGLGRDYMNHLARTYIEGQLHSAPALQQYFAVSFDFIPDLTMDLIIPWLSQITGIYAAGAITIWLAFVLPPLAGIVLAHTLHGRVTWVSLVGFLTVFNANMGWGFVNFNASIGLALLAFILWIRTPPTWKRTLLFAPLGLFLVANHALAFLAFGYLVFVWELVQFFKGTRGRLKTFALSLVSVDALAMAPGLIFLALSLQGAEDLPQIPMPLFDPAGKFRALLAANQFGNPLVSVISSISILTVCGLAIRNRWVVFADRMGWVCAAFLGLVVLMPTAIFGIWGLDFRFTALLVILFAASVQVSPDLTQRSRLIASGFSIAVFALVFCSGAAHMARIDRQGDEFRGLLAELPSGSKLLVASSSEDAVSAFSVHGAAMAVIERHAFVPSLFTNTSWVDVTPAMVDFHMPQSSGLLPEELRATAMAPLVPSKNGFWSPYFANDWPVRWDYVVLFRTPEYPGLEGLPVCEVSAISKAILYKTGSCD